MTKPSGRNRSDEGALRPDEELPFSLQAVRQAMGSRDKSPGTTTAEEEALRVVRRALKDFGDQGRVAVDDFAAGNRIRLAAMFGDEAKFDFRERFQRLQLDVAELEDGKQLFGTAEEMLGQEDFAEFRKDWTDAQKRATLKGRPAIDGVRRVGSELSRP